MTSGSSQSKLEDGFSSQTRPLRHATKCKRKRARECSSEEVCSSLTWDAVGCGMPLGWLRVRTGGGPPGRSLAREKAEHGGAAAATPTRFEEQRCRRLANVESSKRSCAGPTKTSTGSRRAQPRRAMQLDTGEAAPANRSRKRRFGGTAGVGARGAGADTDTGKLASQVGQRSGEEACTGPGEAVTGSELGSGTAGADDEGRAACGARRDGNGTAAAGR